MKGRPLVRRGPRNDTVYRVVAAVAVAIAAASAAAAAMVVVVLD